MMEKKLKFFYDILRESIIDLGLPGPLAQNKSTKGHIQFDNNLSYQDNLWWAYPDPILMKQKEKYLNFIIDIEKQKGIQNISLTSKNILFTTGAVDALDLILKCIIHANNKSVTLPTPTFIGFHHWLGIYDAITHYIELDGPDKNRISYEVISQIESRILLLCNPNNPLGTQIETQDLISTLECFEGIVIIDEAYIEFSSSPSSIKLLQNYPNLIILRTCSKSMGIAGLRIGAILAHEQIIETFIKVQPVFNMPSPVITQFEKLLHPNQLRRIFNRITSVNSRKQELYNLLIGSSAVKKIYPSQTNFLSIVFHDPLAIKQIMMANKISCYWTQCNEEIITRMTINLNEDYKFLIKILEG